MSTYYINQQYTLLERAKLSADGKRVLPALDVMDKFGVDEFVKDVPFFEANQGLRHRVVRTTSRPASTRRKFYKGVAPSTATTQVVFEDVILFEQRSETDEGEYDTVENGKELRRQKDMPHAAGILDDFVYAMFNDAKTSGGEYIDGFNARMNSLSYPGHTTSSVPYVWDNGGTNALTSLWLVEYGPQAIHGIYPSGNAVRGSGPLGMSIVNKGLEAQADPDDSTATYYAYVTQFKFYFGLAIANDWKVCRIANINSNLGASGSLDENKIISALNHGKFNIGATRMYCNAWLKDQIDVKAKDKANVFWSTREVFGREIETFRGIPVRKVDDTIIGISETRVT
jgi:hypothetical protein